MFVAMPFRSLAALLSSSLVLFGVLALVSPAPAQPLSLADADLILMGAHAGESSGHWIATAGDVNGDGFADLLVGANRAPNLNDKDTGRVSLIYGGPSLPPVIDLANPLPGSVVQILGTATGDKLGVSVTDLGDFNGDGFDDFALGARGASFLGRSDAGVVYLIFGGASLPPVIDTSSLGASGIVIGGAEARDELGRAVSGAGDFNNDGHPDLLMGAWKADAMGLSNAGRAFILFGGPGLPGVIDLAGAGAAGVVFEGARAGDSAGYAVADLGDFNGDGIDDVVITAEHADPNGSKSGEAYVVLGQANPPAVVSLKDPIASGISATILHGALPGDNLGHACAGAGDFDGDGLDDLVISSEDADRNGLHEVGEVYLIFGSAAPPRDHRGRRPRRPRGDLPRDRRG
ncbi:MAG: integrin alpha [Planctomycetota bacterium]